ncbi:LOW QUALITY PROTEIN: BRD4-interacting chromatin-remodeling complex-associated protein [Podargus strigoides]
MDDEDGRCLLDVICDPQALNDFLHGSEKIESEDLLDPSGDAASAFFEGAGLHGQESAGNHLSAEPSQPSASVDLDFLEDDDILGSPSGAAGAANLSNSEQPCDILQQSLQEANITEQTLEAEAELDLGSFQLPTLQPVVQTASDGTPQIFSGGTDLIGLQQPAVLTHQALVGQSVGADVVNKAISVQPFLQQVGLGNVTIQPISNLQGLPNGSPGGTLGIGPIQVVGQQVMAINQSAQPIIAKPSQVAAVGGYIAQTAPGEQQQVTLTSAGVSPQNTGLVIQKNLPTVATTTLNGNSVFGAQGSQPLTVTSNLSSPLVQAQNVIIHRTPTPIQPKPAGVLQQKLYQITPKPFPSNNATLTIQNEPPLQQQKTQQNLTFMTGKPGQNVVLSGFPPQGLPANVFKQPPPQQQALSKPMSVHLVNQGSSIVIPAQHVPQAVLQGQNQFLLPGQLAGASTVQIPQQLSALPTNMGGQILTTSHPAGQAHIITSQGPGGQLITNQALPAQILTNQNITGQLNLGQVLTSQNAHGTAHILSAAPIQLQPGQVGQPALFQMPVSLAGSLTTQSQPSVATNLGQPGQAAVIQGVTLPNQVAMLNATENLNQTVNIQPAGGASQSPGLVQAPPAALPGADQSSILTVQTSQPPASLQLNVPPPPPPAQPPGASQTSPNLTTSPEKIILGQAAAGAVINQDSMQMFLQQLPAGQQKLPGAPPTLGESPQLPAPPPHLSQIQSPHPSRPPSQPQPLSRPPSRPHSRPPSQPQTLSRPPSEPLSRSCTPQTPALFLPPTQAASSSPLAGGQHPLHPPSQPPLPEAVQPPAQGDVHPPPPHYQLQFPPQGPLKAPTPTHALHINAEQPRSYPGIPGQFPTTGPNPAPPQKQTLDRFQQVPQGLILQAKQPPPPPGSQPAPPGPPAGSSILVHEHPSAQVWCTSIVVHEHPKPWVSQCLSIVVHEHPSAQVWCTSIVVHKHPGAQASQTMASQCTNVVHEHPSAQVWCTSVLVREHPSAQVWCTSILVHEHPGAQVWCTEHPGARASQCTSVVHEHPKPWACRCMSTVVHKHRGAQASQHVGIAAQASSTVHKHPVARGSWYTSSMVHEHPKPRASCYTSVVIHEHPSGWASWCTSILVHKHPIGAQALRYTSILVLRHPGARASWCTRIVVHKHPKPGASLCTSTAVHEHPGARASWYTRSVVHEDCGAQASQTMSILVHKHPIARASRCTSIPLHEGRGARGSWCTRGVVHECCPSPILDLDPSPPHFPISRNSRPDSHREQTLLQRPRPRRGEGPGRSSGNAGNAAAPAGEAERPEPGAGAGAGKGPVPVPVVGKGLGPGPGPGQSQALYEPKAGGKKTTPLQPSKEARFLERLHRHQAALLHPDYKTPFRSYEDAVQRLLPYHLYQGTLPSPEELRRVDEEFEAVSAQLLRRTQAMLNKYRLLLLEESQRVSPSAEMVMIERMFIQEEKTALALDRQLAKERPAPLPPTKLVIRRGGSPSVTWATAPGGGAAATTTSTSSSSSWGAPPTAGGGEEDPLPSRSGPPMKTYEARSRGGLKLKIKQEAGRSKVIHNTALDPPLSAPHPAPPNEQDPPGIPRIPKDDAGLRRIPKVFPRPHVPPEKRADGGTGGTGGTGGGTGGTGGGAVSPPKPPKSRSDVDNASFSSDSPQDDALTQHLQSAIDSILNLQQPPPSTPQPQRGLGSRTLNR